ncbi:bilin-binding protein-like [Epargyreus clarus]|uniref:bilin-binding protein-like n=1 Tax=Epargyreus clarus TaxID=520877 RepID=UPI003C309925
MLRYFLFAVFAVAAANVIHDGTCPEMKPVENFNVTAYTGSWYEISKYPYDSEKNGKCTTAEYTADGEGLKLKNIHIVDGVQTYIEGTVKLQPDANNTAKLAVTLKFGDVSKESALTILSTDYDNYAIAYNCKYDDKKKTHQDFAWILARTKTLEGEVKTKVDNFIKNTPELDSSKFQQTDFSEEACKFNSSSLLTEPGAPKS